jgi:hypothetical protein
MNSPITIQSKAVHRRRPRQGGKLACKSGTELTFALIALAHYLPTDSEWTARDGKHLVARDGWWRRRSSSRSGVPPAAARTGCSGSPTAASGGCGPRARSTATTPEPTSSSATTSSSRSRNSKTADGSFSTEWFKYPADRDDDIDRKIQTTGHILEWLVASLDQDQLFQPRVVAAVEFLSTHSLAREPSREWKIGPLGHALHALTIYQERAWGTVLPGGIAAFHGPMKADPMKVTPESRLADQPATGSPAGEKSPRPAIRR